MANFQILLKHLFYFQTGLLFFQATPVLAFCGEKPQIPQKTPTTFILAMGANIGELEKANSDAQALADAIQKRFNVPASNTCVLKNVNQGDFLEALEHLQELARKSDKVFLYFSGHGTQVEDNNNDEGCYDEAFVIFHNNISKMSFTITDDLFVKQVNKIDANVITIIDSCFAGGMLRGTKNCSDMKSKLHDKNIDSAQKKDCPSSEIKRLKGTVYMASKEYQLAWESSKGGIFTTSLIENIKNMEKSPEVKLNEIFDMTAEQVSRETRQKDCGKWQEPQRRP